MIIPFFDCREQNRALRDSLCEALDAVVDSGQIILGEQGSCFEAEFARWIGARHAIGVANGTDALVISLRCLGVRPGDEVVTVANSAVATASAICQAGATPVFADILPDTLLMDPEDLKRVIGPKTKAIVPVHLYGNPAGMEPIMRTAREAGIAVVEDACQAHGAVIGGRRVGTFGNFGCFSFYPTKNLGALGDGGMIVTDNDELAERARRFRFYGFDRERVSHEVGQNSRLDELQAAFLRIKLARLDEWIARRRDIAEQYAYKLGAVIPLQCATPGGTHVYHLFVVRVQGRDAFRHAMRRRGVETAVHYAIPLCEHPAYSGFARALPVTREVVLQNVSLPLYPEMTDADVLAVVGAARAVLEGEGSHA